MIEELMKPVPQWFCCLYMVVLFAYGYYWGWITSRVASTSKEEERE